MKNSDFLRGRKAPYRLWNGGRVASPEQNSLTGVYVRASVILDMLTDVVDTIRRTVDPPTNCIARAVYTMITIS